MIREQYLKMVEMEKDFPIKKKWFKHKLTNEYEFRIDILELNDYDEV